MSDKDLALKLDAIQTSLDEITNELAESRRQRQEMQELKEDLTRIAKDVMHSAVEELEDVAPFVKTGDFLHLLKLIVRNTNNITDVISKLESALDFFEDFKPIGQELFHDALEKLDDLDRARYFEFARETKRIADNVVTHFSTEDVRLLADNIVPILETVKAITQPQMLNALSNAVQVFDSLNTENIEEYSIWKTMRELNTPEMKRGMGFMVAFLKNISQADQKQPLEEV